MSLSKLTRDWLWSMFIARIFFAYSYTISTVYLWNHLESKHNAVAGILAAGFGTVASQFCLNGRIRTCILKHGISLLLIITAIDAGTELFLLVSPFTKLIGDVIAGPFTYQILKMLVLERKNVIYQNPEDRILFDVKFDKYTNLALVVGCVGVLCYSPDIEVVVGISVLANVLQFGLMVWRFKLCDRYMCHHGLEFAITR